MKGKNMTTEEKIAVMQAYVDGKTIQSIWNGDWADVTEPPIWNWRDNQYRIKPEEKYRPYKDYGEMVDDFCERFGVNCPVYAMPMIWLKSKRVDYKLMISCFNGESESWKLLKTYFNDYTYIDGSPVGKEAE